MAQHLLLVQASDVFGEFFQLFISTRLHKLTICQPIKTNGVEWCDIGGLNLTTTTSQNSKRDLGFDVAAYALDSFASY